MLWLPPSEEQRLQEVRLRDTAERLQMVYADPVCFELTRWVRQFDPWVTIVKAHENAAAPGIRPGYYHVMRFNQNAPLSFLPIEAKDGGFIVPDSSVLERLRRTDLWNTRVVRDRTRAIEREQQAKAKADELEHEERRTEIQDRWNAATRTQVSMNPDTPWTQNASAQSRRDREARKKVA